MITHDTQIIERLRNHIATRDLRDIQVIPPLPLPLVNAAEAELGFALPDLLRDIHTQIGSGYLNFQCPLLELTDLQSVACDNIESISIIDLYQDFKVHNIVPNDDDPLGPWPDQLIPFCSWGCHIYSCVDCSKSPFSVFGYNPSLYEYDQLFLHFPSLSGWMEAYLDGDDLWAQMKQISRS